jgi:hypothetical protein
MSDDREIKYKVWVGPVPEEEGVVWLRLDRVESTVGEPRVRLCVVDSVTGERLSRGSVLSIADRPSGRPAIRLHGSVNEKFGGPRGCLDQLTVGMET